MEDIQLQDNKGNNVYTFKILAEVFGVIYELLIELDISVEAVLASVWKSKIGITSLQRPEQKLEAQSLVKNLYKKQATEDESDAICIGHSFLNKERAIKKSNEIFDWSN